LPLLALAPSQEEGQRALQEQVAALEEKEAALQRQLRGAEMRAAKADEVGVDGRRGRGV
jgi:hypothetical protein